MSDSKNSKRKRRLWILILLLSILLLIAAVVGYGIQYGWWDEDIDPGEFRHTETRQPDSTAGSTSVSESVPYSAVPDSTAETEPNSSQAADTEPEQTVPTETEPEETDYVAAYTAESIPSFQDGPVDFEALTKINDDIYAWLYVPLGSGRDIDMPVLQSGPELDDNFYLHHNIYKKYLFSGSAYTQRQNSKNFDDRVTVIYGHNMRNGTKFSNLLLFQDKTFFKNHDVFYIYQPGRTLTYRIVAAIEFDKRHILNNFNMKDDQVFEDWVQNYILHPKTLVQNVRAGVEITTDDKIVILSTCRIHNKSRYLIQGVLISDEPTS